MPKFEPKDHPHRRHNPLTGDWVLVSPHRAKRPWQGQVEAVEEQALPSHDPACYLCPGNTRVHGDRNPNYSGPYVFNNDYPALIEDSPGCDSHDELFRSKSVNGTSRVICYSEAHNLTLPEMEEQSIVDIVQTWCEQYQELGQRYRWIQIFENKGLVNGCSNPHPHGQLWASDGLPQLPEQEDLYQRRYFEKHGKRMLLDYALRELESGERVVCRNEDWLVVVPYWATWPFETLLLPLRAVPRMTELVESERRSLAKLLKQIAVKYDNLFSTSFPYSMGWHGAPFDDSSTEHWQLHAHFYPPLLRSASVKKFMVGYEMLCEPQRDLTPEQAAGRLEQQSTQHYKNQVQVE